MPKNGSLNPADYIEPLYMNGLHGRMLRFRPRPRKPKEIMVVYGQHTSLERMFSLAESLNKYGGVTIPDLPGFGGMQSFYKLKEKPTTDNLADYLASFVKLRYKNRRVTIIGVAFGFAVVTRMLQRYPEISKKVDILISLGGFVHHDDLIMNKTDYYLLRYSAKLLSFRASSTMAKLFLRPAVIRTSYLMFNPGSPKLVTTNIDERDQRIAFEIHLWRTNDLRTQMFSTSTSLKLDLCNAQAPLAVHHVAFRNNKYINDDLAEQHLGVIYSSVTNYTSRLSSISASLYNPNDVSKLIPTALRKILTKA